MSESIIKRGRRGEYTVIQNSALRDKRLSLKTKGLFCIMISLPEDWTFSISGLASFVGVGKDAIRVSLRELQDAGYLLREQAHDDGGKFASTVYVLQENAPPLSENPTTVAPWLEKPTTVKPSSENPTTVTYLNKQNKDLTKPPITPQGVAGEVASVSASKSIPKHLPERFEKFWQFYPSGGSGKGSKQRAAAAWDKLKPDEALLAEIGRALEKQMATEMWSRGVGIPYASTYLNGRRWEEAAEIRAPQHSTGTPIEQEAWGWQ